MLAVRGRGTSAPGPYVPYSLTQRLPARQVSNPRSHVGC